MHSVLASHFLHGGSYLIGGASEFAHHFIPPIDQSGGRVLVRAPVKEIVIENGKAVGKCVKHLIVNILNT